MWEGGLDTSMVSLSFWRGFSAILKEFGVVLFWFGVGWEGIGGHHCDREEDIRETDKYNTTTDPDQNKQSRSNRME